MPLYYKKGIFTPADQMIAQPPPAMVFVNSLTGSVKEYIPREDYSTVVSQAIEAEKKGDELYKLGQADKAMKEYNKVLVLDKLVIGDDHPVTNSFKNKMASDEETWEKCSLRKAMGLLYKGLKFEKTGDYLKRAGKPDLAKAQYEKALKIESLVLGPEHDMTNSMREKIVLCGQ